MVKLLLDHGADVNARHNSGATPLMWASMGKTPSSFQIINELLTKGADVRAKDIDGKTALSWAKQFKHDPDVIKLIREAEIVASKNPQPASVWKPDPKPTPEVIEKILHVDNVTNVPVAVSWEAYADMAIAVWDKDFKKELSMVYGSKKVMMVPNDSAVIVLEPSSYASKVKIVKTKRVGWVKSAWLQ